MSSNRTLYHTPLSPFCRKIRIVLKEKGLEFDLVEEAIWECREEFFRLNPAGEVPVLSEDNWRDDLLDKEAIHISGSYAIAEYLEERYPTPALLGTNIAEHAEVRRLVTWFDFKFYQEVSQYVLFEKVFRRLMEQGEPDSETIRAGKRNLHHHLDYISHLVTNNSWLAGEFMSLADITAAAHLSSLDYLNDIPWDDYPQAKEWYALMKSRPSFRPLLADRMRGFRPPVHYDNPDF